MSCAAVDEVSCLTVDVDAAATVTCLLLSLPPSICGRGAAVQCCPTPQTSRPMTDSREVECTAAAQRATATCAPAARGPTWRLPTPEQAGHGGVTASIASESARSPASCNACCATARMGAWLWMRQFAVCHKCVLARTASGGDGPRPQFTINAVPVALWHDHHHLLDITTAPQREAAAGPRPEPLEPPCSARCQRRHGKYGSMRHEVEDNTHGKPTVNW